MPMRTFPGHLFKSVLDQDSTTGQVLTRSERIDLFHYV